VKRHEEHEADEEHEEETGDQEIWRSGDLKI
jgi:hypothetical protein